MLTRMATNYQTTANTPSNQKGKNKHGNIYIYDISRRNMGGHREFNQESEQIMTYAELKHQRQAKYDELFKAVGLFWAFSNEQFDEGKAKNPVTDGHKYTSIGGGGFFPGQNKQQWIDGMDAINAWEKQANAELKANRAEEEKAILYELNNHEAFYSGEIEEVVDLFEGVYTREQIRKVYKKYQSTGGEYKKAFDAANGR